MNKFLGVIIVNIYEDECNIGLMIIKANNLDEATEKLNQHVQQLGTNFCDWYVEDLTTLEEI